MQILDHAWIHVVDGKVYEVRPDKEPAFMEIKRGDDFQSALENRQISEWRLAPGQTVPTSGEADIELHRDKEYEPPKGRAASVDVPDGDGTLLERVKRIQRRYEVNGWDF